MVGVEGVVRGCPLPPKKERKKNYQIASNGLKRLYWSEKSLFMPKKVGGGGSRRYPRQKRRQFLKDLKISPEVVLIMETPNMQFANFRKQSDDVVILQFRP